MNLPILRSLPVIKVGVLNTHPEPHHLQVLFRLACRCGHAPLFVEQGVTNGQVTHAFLEAMAGLPGSELVLLDDQIPEHVNALVEAAGMQDRVTRELPAGRIPSLWFVGRPEYAIAGVEQAERLASRLIVIYDWRTAERYGFEQFVPSALSAAHLKACSGRSWNSLCSSLAGQHTRRGMLVSEMLHWPPEDAGQAKIEAPPEVVELSPAVGPSRSRFGRQALTRKTGLPAAE